MRFYVIQNNFFIMTKLLSKLQILPRFLVSASLKRSIYALKLSFLIRWFFE